jgi:hypothetical protein
MKSYNRGWVFSFRDTSSDHSRRNEAFKEGIIVVVLSSPLSCVYDVEHRIVMPRVVTVLEVHSAARTALNTIKYSCLPYVPTIPFCATLSVRICGTNLRKKGNSDYTVQPFAFHTYNI